MTFWVKNYSTIYRRIKSQDSFKIEQKVALPTNHCMNFGIYKTFTFHVNMPKDPLSSPLHGITSPLPSKVKDLKVIFLSSLLDVSKTVMSHFVVSLR